VTTSKSTYKSNRKLSKDAAMQTFSKAILMTTMGIAMISPVHAEQYCKSVDKDGNATYTRAPDQGCSSKKLKTIAIHRLPSPTAAPVVATAKPDPVKTDAAPVADPAKAPVAASPSVQPDQVQSK
jgi:hypothetical protein